MTARTAHARALFAPLGPTYDRVGAVLSLGQDPLWRRFLVGRLPGDGGHVLDVATGTGLVAEQLLRRGFRVTGLDQSPDMLAVARRRLAGRAELVEASAESLPFPDASFDHLTVTYLLRYVDEPGATLAELARVVRPGGTVASLEFGVPRGPARPLWDAYVGLALPLAGRAARTRLARRRRVPRRLDPRLLGALPARPAARALARSGPPRPPRYADSASAAASSSGGAARDRLDRGGAPRLVRARAGRLARLRDARPRAVHRLAPLVRRDRRLPRRRGRVGAARRGGRRLRARSRDRRARARRAAREAASHADPGRDARPPRLVLDRRSVRDRARRRADLRGLARGARPGRALPRRRLQPRARSAAASTATSGSGSRGEASPCSAGTRR